MTSASGAWTCRPYRSGDERALAALFERVFERPMSADQWLWKLGSRGAGVDNVWLAVDESDAPICHYGGVVRTIRIDGEERTVMVVADAMTAPEYRRQGAFTAVAHRAHDAWREAGVAFVLGMPNEQHGSTMEAVGWQLVTSLRWAIRPLRLDRLIRRRSWLGVLPGTGGGSRLWNRYWDRGTPPPGVTFATIEEADASEALAHLSRTAPPSDLLVLNRDPDWLIQRLLRAPDVPYELLVAAQEGREIGCVAYRVREVDGRRIGAIAEILAPGDGVADWLVRQAARRLQAAGAETAIALAVPGGQEQRALRRRGFLFSWGSFGVFAVILDPGIDADRLRAGRWALSGADFDVV
jgi:hypothetical protein